CASSDAAIACPRTVCAVASFLRLGAAGGEGAAALISSLLALAATFHQSAPFSRPGDAATSWRWNGAGLFSGRNNDASRISALARNGEQIFHRRRRALAHAVALVEK